MNHIMIASINKLAIGNTLFAIQNLVYKNDVINSTIQFNTIIKNKVEVVFANPNKLNHNLYKNL